MDLGNPYQSLVHLLYVVMRFRDSHEPWEVKPINYGLGFWAFGDAKWDPLVQLLLHSTFWLLEGHLSWPHYQASILNKWSEGCLCCFSSIVGRWGWELNHFPIINLSVGLKECSECTSVGILSLHPCLIILLYEDSKLWVNIAEGGLWVRGQWLWGDTEHAM